MRNRSNHRSSKCTSWISVVLAFAFVAPSVTSSAAQAAPVIRTGPRVSISDVTLQERTGGFSTAVFSVTLDKASGRIITVDFTTPGNGTASLGDDYAYAAGTLTFNKLQKAAVVSVPVVADGADEPDETFEVALSNPGGGAAIVDGVGVATIVDDDEPSPPTESAVDLAVSLNATPQVGSDFLVEDRHRVDFAFANASGLVARDVRVRLTFDDAHPPLVGSLPTACSVVTTSELVCTYGDTADGGSGSFTVSYDFPKTTTINATVESQTTDPSPGNDTRTAALNVRNRQADLSPSLDHSWIEEVNVDNRVIPQSEDNVYPCAGACSRLLIRNLGPDPVWTFSYRYGQPSVVDVDNELRPLAGRIVAPPGNSRPVPDSSIGCTTDVVGDYVCTVALDQPLMAEETFEQAFDVRADHTTDGSASNVEVSVPLDPMHNPDGTLIDDGEGAAYVLIRAVPMTYDLQTFVSHADGDISFRGQNDEILVQLWNPGFWRAVNARVTIQIPSTVRASVGGFSGCTRIGTGPAGEGGRVECTISALLGGFESNYAWEIDLEYLVPGTHTFSYSASGEGEATEADPSNESGSFTTTVTLP